MEDLRVLTITHLGETAEENDRVTLNPMEIQMTSARHDIRQNAPVQRVTVMFKDGLSIDLFMSEYDLVQVEKAIGTYGFLDM